MCTIAYMYFALHRPFASMAICAHLQFLTGFLSTPVNTCVDIQTSWCLYLPISYSCMLICISWINVCMHKCIDIPSTRRALQNTVRPKYLPRFATLHPRPRPLPSLQCKANFRHFFRGKYWLQPYQGWFYSKTGLPCFLAVSKSARKTREEEGVVTWTRLEEEHLLF